MGASGNGPDSGNSTAEPNQQVADQRGTPAQQAPVTRQIRAAPQPLPPWRVLLRHEGLNEIVYVVETVMMLTPLDREEAINCTLEAHHKGVSLLLVTHRERAELYQQQFASRNLTVSIEPDRA
jgi:ATP-dependent Clp protease adaptor protein ClpS